MSDRPSVLLVQSGAADHEELKTLLQEADITVQRSSQSQLAGRLAHGAQPSVVIFDTPVPPAGGMTTVQALRDVCTSGLIILCANADSVDCIVGLEMGADDVVCRNRDPREILARIRRLIQRATDLRKASTTQGVINFAHWTFDLDRRELVHQDGRNIHLTPGEFKLLAALVTQKGRVMRRDQLLDHISDRDRAPNDRTVDVLLNRLRHKLGEPTGEPRHLVTVHGVGYVFHP